jgi:hypothetical protein
MQIVTLFKFGRREHLQQFREGLLYMNSSAYFAVLESDDEVRSDLTCSPETPSVLS